MDDLMTWADARKLLGMSKGKGTQQEQIGTLGLSIISRCRTGKGDMCFVRREDVISAASRIAALQAKEAQRKAPPPPDAQKFVPRAEYLEALAKIEQKIDRLLSIWTVSADDKPPF